MKWKTFTLEEIEEFEKNSYVKSVNTHKISFTVVFKTEFWERYGKGEFPKAILQSMGLNSDALGESRIRGIVDHMKEQARSGAGFTEGYNWHDKNKTASEDLPVSKRLLRLEQELAYTKQELEFIKKIILADRGAKLKCSSNQDRTSSSE